MYGGLKATSFCVRDSSMKFDFFYCQSDSQSSLGHPVKAVPWAVLYIFSVTDFCDNLGPIICPVVPHTCYQAASFPPTTGNTIISKALNTPAGRSVKYQSLHKCPPQLFWSHSVWISPSYRLFTINSWSPFLRQALGEPAPRYNHGKNLKIPLNCF